MGHHPDPPQRHFLRPTKDIGAVLFVCGRKPDPGVVAEADAEGIVLLSTKLAAYEAAGKLWEAGLR